MADRASGRECGVGQADAGGDCSGRANLLREQATALQVRYRQLVLRDGRIQPVAAIADIGDVQQEVLNLMLEIDAPVVDARGLGEIRSEEVDILKVRQGRVEEWRGLVARTQRNASIPVQDLVDAVALDLVRVGEALAAAAATVAEGLVEDTPAATEDRLRRQLIGKA